MFINDIPAGERGKAVLLTADARLIEAAAALSGGTDIVVIQDHSGVVQGVVTKTDVVKQMSVCNGSICQCPVSAVMIADVITCQGSDHLKDVSLQMKAMNLKNILLVDDQNHFLGLLTSRSILRTLLGDALHEEDQLVDYVSGIGVAEYGAQGDTVRGDRTDVRAQHPAAAKDRALEGGTRRDAVGKCPEGEA